MQGKKANSRYIAMLKEVGLIVNTWSNPDMLLPGYCEGAYLLAGYRTAVFIISAHIVDADHSTMLCVMCHVQLCRGFYDPTSSVTLPGFQQFFN